MVSRIEDVSADNELSAVLRRLTISQTPDGEEHIVGRADLGLYVAIPRPGVVLIEALAEGEPLAVAAERASAVAGEEVNAEEFLIGLGEAGLLAGPTDEVRATGVRLAWVDRIPQAAVKPLFGRVAWAFYATAALTAALVLVLRPDLRPIFDDVWFLTDPIWSLLALFVVSFTSAAGHECWHWLAGRAVGVPARFRVTLRGLFIVFETDLSQLVTLPRRARYSPMLAGIAFDVVLLAVGLLMRLGFREEVLHYPPELDRFLGALVFTQLLVLIWQVCGVAFRTDGYAVLANALGTHNLHRASALTTKYRLRRLDENEAAELANMSSRDRSVASWFWLVPVAGGFFMFWAFVHYLLPFTYGMTGWVGPNITSLAVDTLVFWQSLVLAIMVIAQLALIPLIARLQRGDGQPAVAVPTGPTVSSRSGPAWQALFIALVIYASWYGIDTLRYYVGVPTDATADNLAADALDESCLPGQRVRILDFFHISQQDLPDIVYNSDPPTSGPHYAAAVAPGIYRTHLSNGQTVHSQEHGRVVIHYRPDTSPAVVAELESIGKRFAHDIVVQPNPDIDTQIALTAWGRIDLLDGYDEARIVNFVELFRGRYDHAPQGSNPCQSGS